MLDNHFSAQRFQELYDCQTWPLSTLWEQYHFGYVEKADLNALTDHGFIADKACVWDSRLEGHEFALIARTYAPDDKIDNPPTGLKIIRLDPAVNGVDPGTAIAIVVESKSAISECLLQAFLNLPAWYFAHSIPRSMVDEGYGILVQGTGTKNVKVELRMLRRFMIES